MGWLPDLPDNRDHVFKPRRALPRLPSRVDLRNTGFMPGVYDQGYLGSCTANAVAGAFEYEQKRQGLTDFNPARLFIYYEERRMINTLNEDSGAFIRDGLKVVNHLGAPNETLWPYDISRFTTAPNADVYADGLDHQAVGYATVDNQREFDVKQALAMGVPVVFGFTVYPWFESPDAHGFCNPVLNQQVLGGHAVVAVGYFRLKNKWWAIVRNSWGQSWGDSGYCYMPLRWICDYWNADDFWTVLQVEGLASPAAMAKGFNAPKR
jgi:C1A family cysteine protease